jgi:hypothetical protein
MVMSSALNVSKTMLGELSQYMKDECNGAIDAIIEEGRIQIDPEYDDNGEEMIKGYLTYNHLIDYAGKYSDPYIKDLLIAFRNEYMNRLASLKYIPWYVEEAEELGK